MMAQGTVLQNYAHILELLLRLRQACDHPGLVINDRHRRSQRLSQEKKMSTSKQLQPSSQQSSSDAMAVSTNANSIELVGECNLCLEPMEPKETWTTKCGHTFCQTCIAAHMRQSETDPALCPVCNEPIQFDRTDSPLSNDEASEESSAMVGVLQDVPVASSSSDADKMQTKDQASASAEGEPSTTTAAVADEPMEISLPQEPVMDLRRSMAIAIPPLTAGMFTTLSYSSLLTKPPN